MSRIGTVVEIWRYPVKSMAGERLDACTLDALGIAGDRGWAVRDQAAGEIRGAKKLPALMQCTARYVDAPTATHVPAAEITLPDGTRVRSDAPEAGRLLSALLGRAVSLCRRRPPTDVDHYRRGLPDHPEMEHELREIFGRMPGEPLPDLSVFPPELFEFTSIPGTYFDALPLHLLTTASLDALAAAEPRARFDRRRFRPNLLVAPDGDAAGYPEQAWCGRRLRIGSAAAAVAVPTPRCVMTTLPTGDLPKDAAVLRTIVRHADQNVGVYATVAAAGAVRTGDPVHLD